MTDFQIILGEKWAADRGIAGRLRRSGAASPFDFAHVLDAVDILVDGANIGASADPDAVACLARDLLDGLLRLRSGEASRAVVPFYESSYELVVQRIADRPFPRRAERSTVRLPVPVVSTRRARSEPAAAVTFFRGGPTPEILLHNHPVALRTLCRTAATAARRLAARFVRLHRGLAGDAFVLDLRDRALRAVAAGPTAPLEEPSEQPLESRAWDRGGSPTLPRLVFRGRAAWTDLLAAPPADRSDLGALLFRGELAAWDGGRRREVWRGRPYLVVERLLDLARHVLEARDARRLPAPLRLQADGLLASVRGAAGDALLLDLSAAGSGSEPVVLRFPDAEALAGAVVALAAELRREILVAAPGQRRNLRLEAFAAEVRQLGAWQRDLAGKALVNADPGAYRLHLLADEEGDRPPPAPVVMGEPRRIRFVERWRLEAPGLDLSATFLCGDRLVASTADGLLALARDDGRLLWRRPPATLPQPAAAFVAGSRGILRLQPAGRAELLDLESGEEIWTVWLRPGAAVPSAITLGNPSAPRSVLVSEGAGSTRGLVALDLAGGDPRWRFAPRRASDDLPFRVLRAGRLVVVACGDSALHALDADSGAAVWRFQDQVRFARTPALARDVLVAAAGETPRSGGFLYGLDALSGRLLWRRPVPGTVLGDPLVCRNVALVATVDPDGAGRAGISAVETTTGTPLWRRAMPGIDRGFAWTSLDDRLVVNAAAGYAVALDAVSGDIAWQHRSAPEFAADVPQRLDPVLRGAALFLPMDAVYVLRPDDGEIVHRLADAPVPDWMRVDERCGVLIAEQSGHLAAYAVASRLAVVK